MNSLFIILGSFLFLFLGYFFYARVIERFLEVNPKNETPAYKFFDSMDFVPARNWLVLFSHHFASIAGAGPIVGPVIGVALWGWWPTLLWIVLGTVFIGGVHDFASIIVSVRYNASSVAHVAEEVISRKSRLIFLGFVWLTLILVIAVFVSVCAKTLTADTSTAIPCFGLILAAVFVGFLLYKVRLNIFASTVIGLVLLLGFIVLGDLIPIDLGRDAFLIWSIVLLVYAFIASVAPVHVLLQPRDYLSSFLLYFGIIVGVAGIFITQPTVNVEAFRGFRPEGASWMYPMLFVTVACGAISGFHALVSSGTTSKQLPNERYAKRIGYGGMALEGFLAVIALLAVSAGLSGPALKGMLAKGGAGPIGAFGKGFSVLTLPLLFGKGHLVAILILNAFILTTLDTATRIGRYLSEELFKIKNRFLSSVVVVLASGALALSGRWNKIWPMFGAANQLVAALTFIVISSWLLCRGKSLKFTILPALFMLTTSISAILYQLVGFVKEENILLSGVSVVLLVLAGMMVVDMVSVIWRRRDCLYRGTYGRE